MSKNGFIYEFYGFRVDPEKRCLWHDGELVSLTPKAVETLLVLIENSGEIVDKQVLLDEVWSDTFVEESTLSQNILTLRKTLASLEAGKKFIATVPRRGYRFVAPVLRKNGVNGGNGSRAVVEIASVEFAQPEASDHGRPVETGPQTSPRSYRRSGIVAAAVLLLTAIAAVWYVSRPQPMVETRFREFRVSNLLSDANIRAATISPDGTYVSLIEKRGDMERLLVRQIDEANPLELASSEGRITGATFSPDGRYVFYSAYRQTEGGRLGELFRVPVLGGVRQLIVKDIDSPVSITRSGELAFIRRRPNEGDTQLIVAAGGGSNERVIATRREDEAFTNAAISADGTSIVCATRSKDSLEKAMELVVVETATGRQRPMTSQAWLWIGQAAWLGDGSGVAVVAYGPTSPTLTDEIWFVSAKDGTARLLESGVNGVFGVSLTDDGGSLVAVKSEKISSFLVSPVDDLSRATIVVTKTGDISLLPLGVQWPNDDRLLYSTTISGSADLWSVAPDGTSAKQVMRDKSADLAPRLSADGQKMFFLSNRSGLMSVWQSNADGSDPQKLTNGRDVFSFDLSPDGTSLYYTARAGSVFSQRLWRISVEGGEAVELTSHNTLSPRISADGQMIACLFPEAGRGPMVLTLLSSVSGEVIRQYADRKTDTLTEWAKDGRSLIVVSRSGPGSSLWRVPVDGGATAKLQEWPNETIFRMAVSPKGDRLFYEKGVTANNVVLLRDPGVRK